MKFRNQREVDGWKASSCRAAGGRSENTRPDLQPARSELCLVFSKVNLGAGKALPSVGYPFLSILYRSQLAYSCFNIRDKTFPEGRSLFAE